LRARQRNVGEKAASDSQRLIGKAVANLLQPGAWQYG